jgi:hypothetical protein
MTASHRHEPQDVATEIVHVPGVGETASAGALSMRSICNETMTQLIDLSQEIVSGMPV